jgi:molecular chaperone HtpG
MPIPHALSWIEGRAEEATKLDCFKTINIRHVRSVVEEILNQFGRDGFFREFTTHDISHIDEMFNICDRWLIDHHTKSEMTLGDYLMLTLAIYLHDAGLVITEDEFNSRNSSGFEQFKSETLLAGSDRQDYLRNIERIIPNPIDREKFFYQEFVRYYHGDRIKSWVEGTDRTDLGTSEISSIINEALGSLPTQFRYDLGLICLSHHLDDLQDKNKYKLNKPYGNYPDAEVNIQYIAVILRTADLMHITQNRAPSISFRLINPKNPISQKEWYKQNAVSSVRKKVLKDEDGRDLETGTIEIYADFEEAEGYFGLDSYIEYAQAQLSQSYKWIEASKIETGGKYLFPWRHIDTQNIEARGFLKDKFSFRMDEGKVLDLLTGYTLYNDPNIAVRELIQNSLDAIKLRKHLFQGSREKYKITVTWNSALRELTITDNGNGMSQRIIENHFLKAGSSMYKDEDFSKNNPDFISISRFGIGVLSCFMISDEIEVTSSHADDEQARLLSLRSVHGSYLIQLKDKFTLLPENIRKNGTSIKMRIRDSISDFNVGDILDYWIIFPHSEVELNFDGETRKIGYASTKEAMKYVLQQIKAGDPDDESTMRIVTFSENGFEMSYPVVYDKYFKEWLYLDFRGFQSTLNNEMPICICVEGIRVENGTPGFKGYAILATANSYGPSAPKTNVARSGLEIGRESQEMMQKIYRSFGQHVNMEIERISGTPNISFSKAVEEAYYLLRPIVSTERTLPSNDSLFKNSLKDIPIILIDTDEGRKNVSVNDLQKTDIFWTIEWDFITSVNLLIKNAPTSIDSNSINQILGAVGESVRMPKGIRLVSALYKSAPYSYIYEGRSVGSILVDQSISRIDVSWLKSTGKYQWSAPYSLRGVEGESESLTVYICEEDEAISGIDGFVGVVSYGNVFILGSSNLGRICREALESTGPASVQNHKVSTTAIYAILRLGRGYAEYEREEVKDSINRLYVNKFRSRATPEEIDLIIRHLNIGEQIYDVENVSRELY